RPDGPVTVWVTPGSQVMAKVKPAAWSAAEGSAAVRVKGRSWPRTPSAEPEMPAVGGTLGTGRGKGVVGVRPLVSVAVMVTGVGPAGPSAGVYDQAQVPAASSRVRVPSEAVSVTVPLPAASRKVPVLAAGEPSLTVRAARFRATVRDGVTRMVKT